MIGYALAIKFDFLGIMPRSLLFKAITPSGSQAMIPVIFSLTPLNQADLF